ncbi:hypothetical protein C8R44DRAFT_859367 [Mycena epipterygia]|nr:hypothetical protein C8R44DRAFT_859367 [Mycena epipterygia]
MHHCKTEQGIIHSMNKANALEEQSQANLHRTLPTSPSPTYPRTELSPTMAFAGITITADVDVACRGHWPVGTLRTRPVKRRGAQGLDSGTGQRVREGWTAGQRRRPEEAILLGLDLAHSIAWHGAPKWSRAEVTVNIRKVYGSIVYEGAGCEGWADEHDTPGLQLGGGV